jgi:exopolysaccharide production protein ExoZ
MPGKLNNIQGLRAYVALSVVLFHSGYPIPHLAPFGFYGVDVFFVISGFIMAGICDIRPQKFFLRRLIRIVPTYWIATIGIFILAAVAPTLLKATQPHFDELLKSLLFIPFEKSDGLLQPLLFVGWSLNYEMYFYVVLAIALLFFKGKRAPLAAACVLLVVPFVMLRIADRNAIVRFYSDTRPFEFLLGIAAYYIARAVPVHAVRKLRWFLLTASALVAIELIVFFTLPLPYYPRDWISFGVPSAVLVLSAALLAKSGNDVRSKWIILLGDASYSMYLLHPFVLYFMERVLAKRWPILSCEHHLFGMLLGMVAVCVISSWVYVYFERPLVDWMARRFARMPSRPHAFLSENPL